MHAVSAAHPQSTVKSAPTCSSLSGTVSYKTLSSRSGRIWMCIPTTVGSDHTFDNHISSFTTSKL